MHPIKYFFKKIKKKGGFTLLEIIIAMLLLTVAIFGLIGVTTTVIKGNHLNRLMTSGTTIARDQMEALKSQDYKVVSSSTSYPSWLAVSGIPGFQRRWQATDIVVNNYCTGSTTPYACCTGAGTGVCANAKQINVEVRWQWQGNYRQVALNTLIAP